MNKLSKREQTLIYILIMLVIITAGWYFMISPTMTKNNALKQKSDNLQFELASKKALYENNIDIDDAIKKSEDELKEYKDELMNIMNDYEADVYFSELAVQYSLTPVDLTINEASEQEITAFNKKEDKNKDKKEESKILVKNVQQKVSGTPANVARYLGKMAETPGIGSIQLQYTYNEDSTKEYTILTYNIYMIEK